MAIILALFVSVSCEKETIFPGTGITDVRSGEDARKASSNYDNPFKITGTVELVWKGGTKGSDMGNKPEELLTFMEITAIGGTDIHDVRGELVYTVLETDLSLHREIKADVLGLLVDADQLKGWIVGMVVSDSKGCSGGGHSGHDEACAGDTGDPSSHDGGCSHDTDEGGCSHDDTDEGGCSHDDTDEGGCSHDDTGEGGCSGSDGGPDTHGGSPGGAGSGNPLSGKNCRTGQIIAMKVKDLGTPGANGDHITWKWFDPNAYFVPDIDNISDWPHLCKKEIIEGNIVIHLP